jgi:hypothetical protein
VPGKANFPQYQGDLPKDSRGPYLAEHYLQNAHYIGKKPWDLD